MITDMNNAYLIHIKLGNQVKERINTKISAWKLDDAGKRVSFLAGQIALEKIDNDPLDNNISVVLGEVLSSKPPGQNYDATLKGAIYSDKHLKNFYSLKYIGEDSLESISQEGIIDPEIFAYFVLRGFRPVFNEFEVKDGKFIRIMEDNT